MVLTCACAFFVGAFVAGPVTRTLQAGPLILIPKTCGAGALYTATDQPLGQQLYVCGGGNTWFQLGSLGKSGGLVIVKGVIDVNPDVVPFMRSANKFLATQFMQNGLSLKTDNPRPVCTLQYDGQLWHESGRTSPIGTAVPTSKDTVAICIFTGKIYEWYPLY